MIQIINDIHRMPSGPLTIIETQLSRVKLTGSRMIKIQMQPWKANQIMREKEITAYRIQDANGDLYDVNPQVLMNYIRRNPKSIPNARIYRNEIHFKR